MKGLSIRGLYYLKLILSIILPFIQLIILKLDIFFIKINSNYLLFVSSFLKYHMNLKFDRLVDILAVDRLSKGSFRFELTYIFYSLSYSSKMGVKTFNSIGKSLKIFTVYSLSNIFKSANWLEREIWDMYGIRFAFHKELIRILTDYGFKGYPLRKDFPLYGYVDLYYSNSEMKCILSPIILSQAFRNYSFENPWLAWKD